MKKQSLQTRCETVFENICKGKIIIDGKAIGIHNCTTDVLRGIITQIKGQLEEPLVVALPFLLKEVKMREFHKMEWQTSILEEGVKVESTKSGLYKIHFAGTLWSMKEFLEFSLTRKMITPRLYLKLQEFANSEMRDINAEGQYND